MGKLHVRLPRLPAPEFFSKASHTIRTADGSALLSYDPETRAGFVYYLASGVWTISAPVDFTTFALHARLAGHIIGESDDAVRWLRACSPNPAGSNVVGFPTTTRH